MLVGNIGLIETKKIGFPNISGNILGFRSYHHHYQGLSSLHLHPLSPPYHPAQHQYPHFLFKPPSRPFQLFPHFSPSFYISALFARHFQIIFLLQQISMVKEYGLKSCKQL